MFSYQSDIRALTLQKKQTLVVIIEQFEIKLIRFFSLSLSALNFKINIIIVIFFAVTLS